MIKYFISFVFTDKNGIPRFGNCFYTSNKNIEDLEYLKIVTQDITNANNIQDVVVINYKNITGGRL